MNQAAQDVDDGETRHESREAEAREHKEVQWTKHASRSDSQAQQPDLTSQGGVLGECVYARCPHHRPTTTNTAQPQRVGALLPMPSCLGIGGHSSGSRQGHPRYTGARTTERPWVAHTNAQRAKCTCHVAYSRQSNTQVFRQTETKWNATDIINPGGQWDKVADLMMESPSGAANLYFVQPVHWTDVNSKVKEVEDYLFISARMKRPS